MSDDGGSARERRRLVLASMLVLLLTVETMLWAAVRAANVVGLRAGRMVLLGPQFAGTVRLRTAALRMTPDWVEYSDGAESDWWRVQERGPQRHSLVFDYNDPLRHPACAIRHWDRWVLIEELDP